LYWRELDGQYHESASHIERASIGCRDQVLDFRLPEIQIGGLRLDLSDRPGYLHLQDISLRTCDGSLIWCWSGDIAELEVVSRQEIEFAHSNDNNVVAIVTG
jgi:hypothetical protein